MDVVYTFYYNRYASARHFSEQLFFFGPLFYKIRIKLLSFKMKLLDATYAICTAIVNTLTLLTSLKEKIKWKLYFMSLLTLCLENGKTWKIVMMTMRCDTFIFHHFFIQHFSHATNLFSFLLMKIFAIATFMWLDVSTVTTLKKFDMRLK